jgi:hypothetical protein
VFSQSSISGQPSAKSITCCFNTSCTSARSRFGDDHFSGVGSGLSLTDSSDAAEQADLSISDSLIVQNAEIGSGRIRAW